MGSAKIFKKSSPNGRIYVYLGKREYVQCDSSQEEINGIVFIQDWKQTLKGKKVYVQLMITFRHGVEEEETMGLSFKKEMILHRVQVTPQEPKEPETTLQKLLCKKLGDGAVPFKLQFPNLAPNSVLICASPDESPLARQMGVFYDVRAHMAESSEDYVGKKPTIVSMAIRKTMYFAGDVKKRSPSSTVDKGFVFGSGKVVLEVSLEKEVFYHGEDIAVHVAVNNHSKKPVKNIQAVLIQHCELTMIQGQYKCKIARLESQDGCPLTTGGSLSRTILLKPLSQICQGFRGLCLDGCLSKTMDDTNLASSSKVDSSENDMLGVVVSYSARVTLSMGGMGGSLETDVPFKLVHPKPGTQEENKLMEEKTSARSQQAESRRKMFQGQDSVTKESLPDQES